LLAIGVFILVAMRGGGFTHLDLACLLVGLVTASLVVRPR
jgi:hypothetical protein